MAARREWDTLIRNGLVIDGTGATPVTGDIAIKDGRIAARGSGLDPAKAKDVIEADGLWVMPGLLDIHTHFDLEVELDPGLPEAVRHGTTTVLMSNCSLGICFGHQRRNGEDPIVDCFARVENMPKHVLKKAADLATWTTTAEYLDHLDTLKLGINVIPMIPHSMLRAEVMGLRQSVTREPTEAELQKMESLLETAMGEGYVGFSTDALPFHFLAEDPHRKTKIPSQFGSYKELKRLTAILRRWDRLWQATPPKDNPAEVFRNFLLTSGRAHGKPLKVTAVAAMDVAANRNLVKLAKILTRLLNSSLIKGHFRFQALAAPFRLYWDGPVNPLAEEIPELRALNEPDLEDREARQRILADPEYQERFAAMWMHGKQGGLAGLKRKMRAEQMAFDRDLAQMVFHSGCPADWVGETFEDVFKRYQVSFGMPDVIRSEEERAAFDALPLMATTPDVGEPYFVLGLFQLYDTDLRWWTISANRDMEVVKKLLTDPQIFPGFNDSGAHLTNMAFYDGNLRCLQLAQADGLDRVAAQVKRLTRDPADFIGIEAGRIETGDVADIAIIDPEALKTYDSDAGLQFIHRDVFEHEQLVNRSDGVVTHVLVGGGLVWTKDGFTKAHGQTKLGRALRHRDAGVVGAEKIAAE